MMSIKPCHELPEINAFLDPEAFKVFILDRVVELINRNDRIEILLVKFFYQITADEAGCACHDDHLDSLSCKLMYICLSHQSHCELVHAGKTCSNFMIYVSRKEHFNAAHKLFNPAWSKEKNHEIFGPCANENWHGHNYDLIVSVKGNPDPDTGFVVDLKKL